MHRLKAGNREVAVKGILFDKDGTLLNFMTMWGNWAQLIYKELDRDLRSLGSRGIGNGLQSINPLGIILNEQDEMVDADRRGPFAMASAEQQLALLAQPLYQAGLPWNEAVTKVRQYIKLAEAQIRAAKRTPQPMPGLLSFLEQCAARHIAMMVVTADESSYAEAHLDEMGIRSQFSCIVGNDLVHNGKPHPEMILLACNNVSLHPSETVMIGDTNGDMQMGKLAGVALTIGITAKSPLDTDLKDADVQIAHYNELEWH